MVERMRQLQERLAETGDQREAMELAKLTDRLQGALRKAKTIRSKLGRKQRKVQGAPPDLPKDCKKYYTECEKDPPETAKGRVKEYCSRVAWQICCKAGKGGDHCTELGLTKKRGPIK
jgi:hypothetical protein